MDNEHMQLVEDCENRESRLTEWEVNFLASIRTRLEQDKGLTDKQVESLNQMWESVTAKG